MKNITCFISSLAAGGAEHQLAILANMLYSKGYNVSFVTCLNDKDYYTLNPGIERIRIETHNSNLLSGLAMINYFRNLKTDVIISFRERMNLVAILGSLGKKTKIIAGERNFTIGKPTPVGILNQKFLYKFADYIVANSESQARYLYSLNKSWKDKVSSMINYTDLQKFNIVGEPEKDDVIKIGIFARFSPQKNCLRFIEMLKVLKSQSLQPFEFHWYGQRSGKVNDEYYESVVECRKNNEVDDVLFFHDAVTDVPKKMSNFHAIALPSLFEGFSNAIAEGICCGKPMLVSDVSDNSVMVKSGINGYVFDPCSSESMLASFKAFLKLNKEQRLQMAKKSREIAESLFDAEKFVNAYITLIEG